MGARSDFLAFVATAYSDGALRCTRGAASVTGMVDQPLTRPSAR